MQLRVLLGESTGIKTRTATKLENTRAGRRIARRKQSLYDLLRVIAKKIFPAECIKPGATFEETLRRMHRRRHESSSRYVAVA
jgi:hypothetical protein